MPRSSGLLTLGPLGRKSPRGVPRLRAEDEVEGESTSLQRHTSTPALAGSWRWRPCRARNPSPALLLGS